MPDPQNYLKSKLKLFCRQEHISYKLLLDYMFDDYTKTRQSTKTNTKKYHNKKEKSTIDYVPDTNIGISHSIKIMLEI